MDEVIDLERQGWQAIVAGRGREFYDETMTEQAVMVLPGMVLDRGTVLESWDGVPPWESYQMQEERIVPVTGDTVLLVYRATATRSGQDPYRAYMSSLYVRTAGGWKLAFHQQTPAY